MRERLTGDRTPFYIGERVVIPISAAETLEIEVYDIIYKTGAALLKSVDGRKFRAYGYGLAVKKEIMEALSSPTAAIVLSDIKRYFYVDNGYEVADMTHLRSKGVDPYP